MALFTLQQLLCVEYEIFDLVMEYVAAFIGSCTLDNFASHGCEDEVCCGIQKSELCGLGLSEWKMLHFVLLQCDCTTHFLINKSWSVSIVLVIIEWRQVCLKCWTMLQHSGKNVCMVQHLPFSCLFLLNKETFHTLTFIIQLCQLFWGLMGLRSFHKFHYET